MTWVNETQRRVQHNGGATGEREQRAQIAPFESNPFYSDRLRDRSESERAKGDGRVGRSAMLLTQRLMSVMAMAGWWLIENLQSGRTAEHNRAAQREVRLRRGVSEDDRGFENATVWGFGGSVQLATRLLELLERTVTAAAHATVSGLLGSFASCRRRRR